MGVPAVLFNNWPDIARHTSEDRPFTADPTQLKRVIFIALSSLSVMVNAHADSAVRVAELANGQWRGQGVRSVAAGAPDGGGQGAAPARFQFSSSTLWAGSGLFG